MCVCVCVCANSNIFSDHQNCVFVIESFNPLFNYFMNLILRSYLRYNLREPPIVYRLIDAVLIEIVWHYEAKGKSMTYKDIYVRPDRIMCEWVWYLNYNIKPSSMYFISTK